MQELQTENEQPLLVVKYVWWRVIWKLFFPISFGLIIGIGMAYGFFDDIQFGWSKELVAVLFLWLVMIFSSIFMLFMTILFKKIHFYKEKVVQEWYFFGKREIKYQDAYLVISHSPPVASFILIKPKEKRYLVYCYVDRSLIAEGTRENLLSILSKISHRNSDEFNNKGRTIFNPFIKSTQKGARFLPTRE
jgi:phosphate/sulfate permease